MSILTGPLFPGADVLSTVGVTADRLSFVAAATGLTLIGYKVSLQSGGDNARGQIFTNASADNIDTSVITTFELQTGVNGVQEMPFPAPGIDVAAGGVSIDFIAGDAFDVTVFTKTNT